MHDTKEEIAKRLRSLEDFHRFLAERDQAFNAGGVDLNADFVLFGRLWLNGRSSSIYLIEGYDGPPLPDNVIESLDPVLTQQEFRDVLGKNGRKQGWSGRAISLPPPHARCPRCGQGWTIENCHDAHHEEGFDHPSFDEFVGLALREVRAILEKRAKQGGVLYHLSPDVWGGEDTRGRKEERQRSPLSFNVDEAQKEALWDYVIQPGDSGVAYVTTYIHGSCHADIMKELEDDELDEMLVELPEIFEREGGFTSVTVEEFFPDEAFRQRLLDWTKALEEGEDVEEDGGGALFQFCRWMTVRTGEGTFRVGYVPSQYDTGGGCGQFLDLEGTGLTFRDVLNAPGEDMSELVAQMPDCMLESPILAIMMNPEFCRTIRHLLQKKR